MNPLLTDAYVATRLAAFPALGGLSRSQITRFIDLCLRFWNLLTPENGQPLQQLPNDLAHRLSPMLEISPTLTQTCWSALSEHIAASSQQPKQGSLDETIRAWSIDGKGGVQPIPTPLH